MNSESSNIPLPPQIEAWLGEQPDADRRALEETWRLAESGRTSLSALDHQRKAETWSALSNMTQRVDREEMPRPRLRLVSSKTWRWVAAAAVVALLVGVGYILRPVSVSAPNGTFADVVLPDGSVVQLNSGSTLTYRAQFLGRRVVELEGEAFFDVVEDDDAFVVETFNAETTVLGTEFNVRARSDDPDPATTVVVASGSVRVMSQSGARSAVVLEPGERTAVPASQGPSAPTQVVLERELAWRHGGLSFTAQPFSAIFDEVERRFDATIVTSDDIASETFSIYLHEPTTVESVLSNIAQAEGLRFRETAEGYQVYRP